MDLGIKGKKAIVCAASKGLGKGSSGIGRRPAPDERGEGISLSLDISTGWAGDSIHGVQSYNGQGRLH